MGTDNSLEEGIEENNRAQISGSSGKRDSCSEETQRSMCKKQQDYALTNSHVHHSMQPKIYPYRISDL
jgi:hypothetical protein